jgi:hypothetical protein
VCVCVCVCVCVFERGRSVCGSCLLDKCFALLSHLPQHARMLSLHVLEAVMGLVAELVLAPAVLLPLAVELHGDGVELVARRTHLPLRPLLSLSPHSDTAGP